MTINIGCIGAGRVVGDLHFPMLKQLKGYNIVGIYDVDKERAKMISEKFACCVFPTYAKMLESKEIDVVLVTTPSNTHTQYTIQALNAGKHVIVDKPPATTYADLKKMFAVADKNHKKLVTFQNRIWDKDFVTVLNTVKKNLLGDVFHIESCVLYWGFGGYGIFRKWRTLKKYGGGQLNDWGPHLIDQAMRLVPSPVDSVWADLRGLMWSKEVDDHCMLMLRFKNGTTAKIVASGSMTNYGYRWFVCGTKGTLYQHDWEKPLVFRKPVGDKKKDIELPFAKTGWIDFYKEYEKVFTKKAPLPVKPIESLRLLKVIEAARESGRTGNAVKIKGWK
jgi:scyllo-inositol 2-dehydrogenase (NADP+)